MVSGGKKKRSRQFDDRRTTKCPPSPRSLSDNDPFEVELDDVLSVIAHPRRRYLLYALGECSQWTLSELATKLCAWEDDCDEADVETRRRDMMSISLYHAHVPKLVDVDVVEFDTDSETISKTERAERVIAMSARACGSTDHPRKQRAEEPSDAEEEPP